MYLRRKKGANDDSYPPETHSSWKGKLGKAFGIGKKSIRTLNGDSTISFMDVNPFIENAASSSAFPSNSSTPHPTSTLSKSLYRLSHMAKSATNIRHLFSDSDVPEPDLAEFNPPVSTPVSHSGSVFSAYFSTYSRDTLKSALVPSSSINSQPQSPFAETHFPVDLGGQPGRPLVYNVESWNVGRVRLGVEYVTRPLSPQKSARKIVEETFLEAEVLAQRTGEVQRLPVSWETDWWDDSTSAILMSWLGYRSDFEVWETIAFDGHQAVSPFDPRALPGVIERSRPDVVAGPRAHHRSPSADLVDAIPRRRQHSGSTAIQTNIPPTTPTTPRFPPSGRYVSDPDDTPRAPARVRAIERGSPTPSSICLPNEVSEPPRRRGGDIEEIEASLWLVGQDAVMDQRGRGSGNEVERISPRAFMEDTPRSPSMRSTPGHATNSLLEAANIPSPAASTELHFAISQAASSFSAIPHGTQSSQDDEYSDPHVDNPRNQPEGTIPALTTIHPPNILMFPWRIRQQVRRLSVESIDVILTNLESRAPNFPPINLPAPLGEQLVHASRSVKYWFVPPPEPYPLSRISGPVSFFWARFDEGWTTHVPASWDDIESSQMTHEEQVAYYRKKMGELREADRREEERCSRNARYLVERKRRGLPIVPDPHAPPPSFPPRVTPYLYGKDIETRLHRRARALRQMVWNVDRRSISEVVFEEEKFVGWTYRRTIGKRWAWRKEKADSAKSQADAVRRQLSRSRTVRRRKPNPDDEVIFDDDEWIVENVNWDAAAGNNESGQDGEALFKDTHKGPHGTALLSDDVAIGAQKYASDGQITPEGAQESKAKLRRGLDGIEQTIVALETILGEHQPDAANRGELPLQPSADISRYDNQEENEAVQVEADGKAAEHGSSTPEAISPSLTPIRHTPIPCRARHSRNKHSLVDLQLELDKQAAEVADELNILATVAFPLVPRRNSTGEVPEEVRVEVFPPTPMETRVLLMNACQTAEALWHPVEQVGEDTDMELTGWPAATRVGWRQEQGLVAIPSCAEFFGDEIHEDEGSELIDLSAGDREDHQEDEFWTEVSEIEESRLMECAMRDGKRLTALEDVPRIGESMVGSALAWWQAGGVSVGDPSGCWPKGQEGQAMGFHEKRGGGQKGQDGNIDKASASASGGSGKPEMESGEQAAEQVEVGLQEQRWRLGSGMGERAGKQ